MASVTSTRALSASRAASLRDAGGAAGDGAGGAVCGDGSSRTVFGDGAVTGAAGVRADQGQIQPDITVAVPAQAEFNELAQQLEQRLDEAAVTHELRIYCDATGQAFISDAHVSLEQIREQVAGWDSVHIEADANCKHATVQMIATICTEQGVANVTTSVATGSENAEQAPVAEDAP